MSNYETVGHKTEFEIRKRRVGEAQPYAVETWEGNIGLNEGLNLLTNLLCGAGGTVYNNAGTYIGVGDSSTATDATQAGLQAETNKAWVGMETTFPTSGSSQQVVFKSVFAAGVGTFAWEEFTVGNSNDDSGQNLLRAIASRGTKGASEEWTVTITVTFS